MADINTALNASNEAIQQLLLAGERTKTAWTSPRAPGKWSPSQIVEHVARSLEESANMAAGRPSKFPTLPASFTPSSVDCCSSACCGRQCSQRQRRTRR
jgi:hypothetical protein